MLIALAVGAATTQSTRLRAVHDLHAIISLLGREYDNRASRRCRLSLPSNEKRLSPPHIAFSRAGLVPPLSSSDVFSSFLFFSFFFSSLSSKKGTCRGLFSLFSHTAKATPNNRTVFLRTQPASFFLQNPRASGVRGASLLPAAHSRLGFLSGWVCEPE